MISGSIEVDREDAKEIADMLRELLFEELQNRGIDTVHGAYLSQMIDLLDPPRATGVSSGR